MPAPAPFCEPLGIHQSSSSSSSSQGSLEQIIVSADQHEVVKSIGTGGIQLTGALKVAAEAVRGRRHDRGRLQAC